MTPRVHRRRVAVPFRALFRTLSVVAALVALPTLPALAQYKVTGPDGRVTYTDRQPSGSEATVVPLRGRSAAEPETPDLPYELREPAGKYPVMLYTITGACEPCDAGRQLLKQRGIPFNERQVLTAQDSQALERLSGAREAPTLTIGSQVLRGLANEVWNAYLDAAGYPRSSKLPASYRYAPATPIVAAREPAATRPAARTETAPDASRLPPPSPGNIRF